MDTFTAMTVFRRVAELGGFAAAARDLGMSTSAVSRYVADLEADLGTQLLRRTTRKLSLTEAGGRCLDRAAAIVDEVESLRAELAEAGSRPKGLLRVTVPPGLAEPALAPLITSFLLKYPEIDLEVDVAGRLVDLIAEGYDAAIRFGPLSDSAMTVRRLGEFTWVTYAAPDYLACRGVPDHPHELADHDVILWRRRAEGNVWSFIDSETGRQIDIRPTGRGHSNSQAMQVDAVRAGLGVAMLPAAWVSEDVAEGRLIEIMPRYRPAPSTVSIVWPSGRLEPRKLRAFIDHMVAGVRGA